MHRNTDTEAKSIGTSGVGLRSLSKLLSPRGLPPGDGGFTYVVEFSDGTIKPGRSESPVERIRKHGQDGRKFGHTIRRWWVSPRHETYRVSEKALLRTLGRTELTRPREYYSGADFSAVVKVAQSIVHEAVTEPPRSVSDTPDQEQTMNHFSKYSALPEWQALVEAMNTFALRIDNDHRFDSVNPQDFPAEMLTLAETLKRMDSCVQCYSHTDTNPEDASRMYVPIAKDTAPGRYLYRCTRGHVWGCSWGV